MTVVINGKTYEVIDGIYHLVATYGLACEIGGVDVGDLNPNKLLPKGFIADTGCKIRSNPILNYDGQPTMCVLYEDLECDIMLDGDENSHDYARFSYTTTDNKIIYPYPYSASDVDVERNSKGEVTGYTFHDGVTSWYEDNHMYEHTDGGNVRYSGSIRKNDRTIPTRYSSGMPGVFEGITTLKTITTHINPNIGQNCFRGCTSLTEVTILGNDNSSYQVNIEQGAFSGCTSLTTCIIGSYWFNSLDNKVTVGNQCFDGDTQLKHLQGQDNIKSIGFQAFRNCSSLEALTLMNISSIGFEAFNGCTNLERVILKGSAVFGENVFSGCTKLEEIIFLGDCSSNSGITSLMTEINSFAPNNLVVRVENQYLSNYQTKFSGITTSKSWKNTLSANTYNSSGDIILGVYDDGSGVWDTAVAFNWLRYNTRTLTTFEARKVSHVDVQHESIVYNEFDNEGGRSNSYNRDETLVDFNGFKAFTSVTTIVDEAFSGCDALTAITIPSSVTTIGNEAFEGCDALSSVTIGSGVTSIGDNAFEGCDDLVSIIIPDSVTSLGENVFSGCTDLQTANIGNGVTEIKYQTFYDCSSLTSVTIGSCVTSIGEAAFSGCTKLSAITIPSGVTIIENNAFCDCSGSTAITIPSGVTTIGENAFSGCINVRSSVAIPDGVTEIGEDAFYDIPHITYHGSATGETWGARCMNGDVVGSLVYEDTGRTTLAACFPNALSVTIPSTVETINSCAFEYCTGLTSVVIPSSVTSIGNYAFYKCSTLSSITIPDSVTTIGNYICSYCENLSSATIGTGVTNISEGAFLYCERLLNVTIPNGVTSIGSSAFNSCGSLSSITIPSGVTSIGGSAFYHCNGLTNITIPNSVITIGASGFTDCRGLTSVTIGSGVTSIGDWAFTDCTALNAINYNGTTTQWDSISKGYGWHRDAPAQYVQCSNGRVNL